MTDLLGPSFIFGKPCFRALRHILKRGRPFFNGATEVLHKTNRIFIRRVFIK